LRRPLRPSLPRALVAFAVVTVVTVAVVVIVLSRDTGARARDGLGPITLTQQEQHGRALFAERCGSCHTLKGANAVGGIGPSLDMLRPPAPATLSAIRRGPGPMPAGLLNGSDAEAVARFVVAVTAH
jgi:mono/diheme cytochrome c family protein